MRTAPAGFPDDVSLGTLLERTKTGWRRSFAARGPVTLAGRTMALEAAPAALDHLAALPSGLRGLSLAGLEVTDDEVAAVVRQLPALTWLDLRDTAVTAQVLTSVRRLRRLRPLGLNQAVLPEARSSAPPGRIASGSGRVAAGSGRVASGSGRIASGFARIGRRTAVVTEGAVLVPWHSGLPEPDAGGFNAVLNAAVDAYPELGGIEPDEARVRAAVL